MPTLKVFMKTQHDLFLWRPKGLGVGSVYTAETGHKACNSALLSFPSQSHRHFHKTVLPKYRIFFCISDLFFPDLAVLDLNWDVKGYTSIPWAWTPFPTPKASQAHYKDRQEEVKHSDCSCATCVFESIAIGKRKLCTHFSLKLWMSLSARHQC